MALFGTWEKVFEIRGDRTRWKAARQALKNGGLKPVKTSFYETEMPFCGCGAKLDPRDFGPDGRIDRLTYDISVRAEDAARARELLRSL